MPQQRIICTVTNDLTYDQRMIRICTSLAQAGYAVTLVGRVLAHSKPIQTQAFEQHRLSCWFNKGKFFYLEYNLRLFWYLLFARTEVYYAVDLDTILPNFIVSRLRGKSCVYDAHEYFTEVPEVVSRPRTKAIWTRIEAFCVPRLTYCITVGQGIADLFKARYDTHFRVVRNVPFFSDLVAEKVSPRVLLYQGALNEGRGLEAMIKAMPSIDGAQLWLAGEGDLSSSLRGLVKELDLAEKVRFLGYVQPADLKQITAQASIGLNLLENKGLSYYYSLANKAFDYIQATVPSVNMNFPEYAHLQAQYGTFVLVEDLETSTLISAIQELLSDEAYYEQICANCLIAKDILIWEQERKVLLELFDRVFSEKN